MSRIAILRLAKIVPLVTLNLWRQAAHLKRRLSLKFQMVTHSHRGQTGAPFVAAQRMSLKVAKAS
jgi:hypothetical protein